MRITARVQRLLMGALQPITGPRATGAVRMRAASTPGQLAAGTYLAPVVAGSGENRQLDPSRLFFTTALAMLDPVMPTTVPIASVVGGRQQNLPAGAWRMLSHAKHVADTPASPIVSLAPTAGGDECSDEGALRQLVTYEGIGAPTAQRDMFLAKLAGSGARFPAGVLQWVSSAEATQRGPNVADKSETWILYVITSRLDQGELRAVDGMDVLDACEELLTTKNAADGHRFTSFSTQIRGRARAVTSDTSYVYTLTFTTGLALKRRDTREEAGEFPPWTKTRIDVPLVPSAQHPTPASVIDGAVYPNDPDDVP